MGVVVATDLETSQFRSSRTGQPRGGCIGLLQKAAKGARVSATAYEIIKQNKQAMVASVLSSVPMGCGFCFVECSGQAEM